MARSLVRTASALADCDDHLKATGSFGTPIENFLTSHLVMLLCAEVESTVRALIHEYVLAHSEPSVAELVKNVGANLVRNALHSEIRKVLGYLGSEYADQYNDLVRASAGERGITHLGNVVTNRNSIAHNVPPQLTFADVVAAQSAAEQVVQAVRQVLQIDDEA